MSDFKSQFDRQVDRFHDRRFLHEVSSGREWTYGELGDNVRAFSSRLRAAGVMDGSPVGLIVQTGFPFYLCSLALQCMDCQLFIFHPDWTRAAVSRQLVELPCSIYVASEGLADRLDLDEIKKVGASVLLVRDEAGPDLEFVLPLSAPPMKAVNSCVHLATSGTTGLSKWVPKEIREVRSNMEAWARHLELVPEDSIHAALPLCTANGYYITFMMPFWTGASVVLDRRFSPLTAGKYLKAVQTGESSVISLVPTILYLLNRLISEEHREAFQRESSVRFAICGTAPLDSVQKREFERDFLVPVYFNYGITETLFISSQNRHHHDDRSTGSPIEGMDVEVREDGELIVRGLYPFSSYFGEQQGGFTGDGRFETGDMGEINNDRVYVTGRSKQIVIKGGFNIYPSEVDSFIIRESYVLDTFTFGVPNEILGEQLVSTVVLAPDADGEESLSHLSRTLKEQLPPYKVPTIYCVDAIRKTATGKPIKEEMMRYLMDEHSVAALEGR